MEMPSFLAGLEPTDRLTALSFLEEAQVPAGELLMHGSYEGECLAYVVDGEVEVQVGGSVVGRAGPGEWVGETALFPNTPRRATVVVVRDAWLLVLSTEAYIGMRRGEHRLVPILEQEVLGHQLVRLRRQGERLAELSPDPQSIRPSPSFFARISAQFGEGGLLSILPDVDVASALRELGLVDDEETNSTASAIAAVFDAQAVPAGALLCTEGEPGHAMYVLMSGRVDVVKATSTSEVQPLAQLVPGASFGLAALHEGGGRMASCVAATPCTVLALNDAGWRRLVGDDTPTGSSFRRAMIDALSKQLSATNLQLAALSSEPSRLGAAVGSYEGGSGG